MCVLRAYGESFDPARFLASSTLEAIRIQVRGEPVFPRAQPEGEKHDVSGFVVPVSERDRDDLPGQVQDAIEFLQCFRDELERLRSTPGVEDVRLDFPRYLRMDGEKILAQFDFFPAPLVTLAGALGIGLELSLYYGPPPEERRQAE